MTSWAAVGLALAGAPIGAVIALGGVGLSNRHSYKTHRELLESQAQQQRERLEIELRADHLRSTLARRAEIHERLLKKIADEAVHLAGWADGHGLPDNLGPLTNKDMESFWLEAKRLRYVVDVHCSLEVRQQWETLADAIDAVDETGESAVWRTLMEQAETMRSCLIEAAIADRTTGITRDGLGGM